MGGAQHAVARGALLPRALAPPRRLPPARLGLVRAAGAAAARPPARGCGRAAAEPVDAARALGRAPRGAGADCRRHSSATAAGLRRRPDGPGMSVAHAPMASHTIRRSVIAAAAVLLLAGPTILAFFSGGFFFEPRVIAAIATWLLVLALADVGPAPLPRSRNGWLTLGGLLLIAVWSAVSVAWAPRAGPAIESVERLFLYVGALLIAIGALRSRRVLRAVEPALAAGAALVIGYGLAGRLLPGIVHLAHSTRAGGRLQQPLTYWNAEGALAALGLVLCARLAGDRTRPAALRVAAAAAAAPLGLGCYLSFSRGALLALAAGLVVLVVIVPTIAHLRAAAICVEGAALATLLASQLDGVTSLTGDRTGDGALALVVLLAAMLIAAALQAWSVRDDDPRPLPLPTWGRAAGWACAVALAASPFVVAIASERGNPQAGATGQRFGSVGSNRYAYWRAAAHVWADHPIDGAGPASFRAEWLKRRTLPETVRDAHSLEIETLAELGLVGLACLVLLFGGVIAALLRAEPAAAAGPAAALAVWAVHSGVDWDWELPALTLVATALAGHALALGQVRRHD